MNTQLVILMISPPGDIQTSRQALLTSQLDVAVLLVGKESSAGSPEKYRRAR